MKTNKKLLLNIISNYQAFIKAVIREFPQIMESNSIKEKIENIDISELEYKNYKDKQNNFIF